MSALQPHFPPHLTPLERERLGRLIERIAVDPRVVRVRLFGSRARGRSRADSDLDLAVDLAVPRERAIERWLVDASTDSAAAPEAPPLQIVAVFAGEPPSRLDRALVREGIELWTRS
jgi:predicted nucleotidyltransferase